MYIAKYIEQIERSTKWLNLKIIQFIQTKLLENLGLLS